MKIGYIGLGALGSQLARTFLRDHDLVVWDAHAPASEALRKDGARVAPSAAALAADADVVLLCLPRSSDVRQVLFGQGGLAEGLSAGKLVIDQTSGIASDTRAMADELARHGVAMLDAAVSASPHIVAQGGAVLMVGGSDEVFERALPVLRTVTSTIYRCGLRVGDGQAMKTVNNAMNAGVRLGTLEIVALGRRAGLSLAAMSDLLNQGAARNQTTVKMLPALVEGKASTNFSLALQLKDVDQAVALGFDTGAPMPVTAAVRSLLQVGVNTLGKTAQLEDMVGLIESMAGTRLAGSDDTAEGTRIRFDGIGTPDVAKTIDDAVSALCLAITEECVAVGVAYGLELPVLAEVLDKSSGWSAQSQRLLPAWTAGGRQPRDPAWGDALLRAARLALIAGAPTFVANAVRAVVESPAR
ncbi:3-hydroxyisobutyrate dehydrogenase [Pigmentiphaga litoralis]|uniref:3-hydroxyisobutyrate dehydrogenase n=2 Tax=Pigmentiphaga litoralis TaxID=516702 RepID=A0A7Y9LNV9_9BURK|nr:NAD(P)-binding domain-containing protein [Pigmentiphaga litoralis]NYE23164.1 3-hydroxyisobutyrate dehydrogenase [Pigmentiphaga litoralis]NYE83221.1 3-hydroxyisobutyrate dehydrogenase [Pigmentiphaga litoralis]